MLLLLSLAKYSSLERIVLPDFICKGTCGGVLHLTSAVSYVYDLM